MVVALPQTHGRSDSPRRIPRHGRRISTMEATPRANVTGLAGHIDRLLPDIEAVYKDLHEHPELSMQEVRTSGVVADRLRSAGYQVTSGIGKTGVVGVLRNGTGATVMLRADMDALP